MTNVTFVFLVNVSTILPNSPFAANPIDFRDTSNGHPALPNSSRLRKKSWLRSIETAVSYCSAIPSEDCGSTRFTSLP